MIAVKSLLASAVTLVMIAFVMTTPALGQSSRGGHGGGLSAARGGLRVPVPGRNPVKGATVIPNRGGGFTMYGPQGTSRYLGKPQGNKVFHPDGSSSIVIPSAEGGATVYGPQGTHKVFPDGDKSDAEESKTP